jgi:CsoR family transcriptional regulator, copper-sensing transcriptional repressor
VDSPLLAADPALRSSAGTPCAAVHDTMKPSFCEALPMSELADDKTRQDLLNRLKRAEGQLRGIQRMIEENQPCLDIASQMAAVRKALDSTYVRMTVCFMQQELQARLSGGGAAKAGGPAVDTHIDAVLEDVQALLAKLR